MTRVLVVNHDVDLASAEADSLRARGYEVRECPGPVDSLCPILAGFECALAKWADVMVYDAWATGEPAGVVELIDGLRAYHPGVPIVIQASSVEPAWVETTGPLAIIPLVGTPDADRLAAAIDEAVGAGPSESVRIREKVLAATYFG